jgi:hypothetical protein
MRRSGGSFLPIATPTRAPKRPEGQFDGLGRTAIKNADEPDNAVSRVPPLRDYGKIQAEIKGIG